MEAELTGCLIGLLFNLLFSAVIFLFQIALFIISLPIRLVIAGVTSPVRGLAVLVFLGLVAGGLLLTDNPVRDFVGRYIDLDSIQIDIDLEKALEDIQSGLEGLFPGVTTKLTYIITGDGVRGRGCAKLTCGVDRVFQRNETVTVEGIVQGDVVNGNTVWLKIKNGDSYVYVHSSLAMPVEVAIDVTAVVTQTPTPTRTPTVTPTPTPTLTPMPVSFRVTKDTVDCGKEFDVEVAAIWHSECGYINVLEDRDAVDENLIKLAYVRVTSRRRLQLWPPRLGGNPTTAIIYLAGGPGQSVVEHLRLFPIDHPTSMSRFAATFVGDYDVIFFDQRGTGKSEPRLDCSGPDYRLLIGTDFVDRVDIIERALESCRTQLADSVHLHAYNSVSSAKDIEDIRTVFNYKQLNLYGISYGTRLALTYMRYYPQYVRSAVLDGVMGPEASMLEEAQNADRVFDALFDYCGNTPSCNDSYPQLRQTFKDVKADLDIEPIQLHNPEDNDSQGVFVDRESFMNAMLVGFYDRDSIEVIPELIFSVANQISSNETTNPLLEAFLQRSFGLNLGMHYAVLCNEEYVFESIPEFDSVYSQYGEYQNVFGAHELAMLRGCEQWREGMITTSVENDPVHSSIPTLIMSGEFDPVTPPSNGERVAQSLSHSFVVEFPWEGHGSFGEDCPTRIAQDFVRTPMEEPNTSCINDMNSNPFQFHK